TLEPPAPVTDKDVDQQVDMYCQGMAKDEKIEGPGKDGNIVVGEYLQILIDEKEKDLENQKNFRIEIGADKIKEFNRAFKGSQAGEEKEIKVKYPKDYDIPELAGKTGLYKIKVLEIRERNVPKADDDLARKFGLRDLADLRGKIKKDMEQRNSSQNRGKAEKEAVRKLIEAHPFDVPKAKVKMFLEYMSQQTGRKPEEYTKPEQEERKKEAVFNLKQHRIIDQISKKEKIKATQAEVDARITELAEQYGMAFEDIKAKLRQTGKTNDIRDEIKTRKTFDFLLGISS
ncbi:trigger factor, partial [Fibrobacterota bacterium]